MLLFSLIKRDIYGHAKLFSNWKSQLYDEKGNLKKHYIEEGLTEKNSGILIKYIFDMEVGSNVGKGARKGPRSPARLINLRQRMIQILKFLQQRGITDVTSKSKGSIKNLQNAVMKLFSDMERGELKTQKGESYRSAVTYAKIWTAFWHWYQKINRTNGIYLPDISEDINKSRKESKFVWLDKTEFDKFRKYFDDDCQTILLFCYDSLIRSPSELLNLKVSDISERSGEVWLNIKDEISKTFGRSFNMVYAGRAILDYVKRNNLQNNDYLFNFSHNMMNKKLQEVAKQLYGEDVSKGGEHYKNITLYDFRHSGAIHFRVLFKKTGQSIDALRHRGGWLDFKMLNYYTKLLGLDGHIVKEKLLLEEDKTKLEEEVERLKESIKIIQRRFTPLRSVGKAVKDNKVELVIKKQT